MDADDSDTSDEESNAGDDHYPDPHPADPDMTGWTENQLGGVLLMESTNISRSGGETSKGHGSHRAADCLVQEIEQDELHGEPPLQPMARDAEVTQLARTANH